MWDYFMHCLLMVLGCGNNCYNALIWNSVHVLSNTISSLYAKIREVYFKKRVLQRTNSLNALSEKLWHKDLKDYNFKVGISLILVLLQLRRQVLKVLGVKSVKEVTPNSTGMMVTGRKTDSVKNLEFWGVRKSSQIKQHFPFSIRGRVKVIWTQCTAKGKLERQTFKTVFWWFYNLIPASRRSIV